MLRVRSLGRVPYEEAFSLQRSLSEHSAGDYLLALEHPAVFTLGVRADPAHVLVDPASVGAGLVRTSSVMTGPRAPQAAVPRHRT